MLDSIHSFLAASGLPLFEPELDGESHRPQGISHITYEGEYIDLNGERAVKLRVYDFKTSKSFFYQTPHFADPSLSPQLAKLSEAQRAKSLELQKAAQLKAKQGVAAYWETCLPLKTGALPIYCERKGIGPSRGVRADPECSDTLVVPLYDERGELWSLQRIYASGEKFFWPGSRTKGVFHTISSSQTSGAGSGFSGITILTEGYATACTISQASGCEVIVACSASNLSEVARILKSSGKEFIVAADNDSETAKTLGYNPGLSAGMSASRTLACPLMYPTLPLGTTLEDPKDFSDFNDLARIAGLTAVKEQLMIDRTQDPEFIPTQNTGFHAIIEGKNGKPNKVIPAHLDLLKYLHKLHNHKTTYDGALYYYLSSENRYARFEGREAETRLEEFAQIHFNPKPSTSVAKEFKNTALRTDLISRDFFNSKNVGYLNLPNGILHYLSGKLLPHDPEQWGFTSCLPFEYDEAARAPRFEQFLDDITLGREDLKRNLLEFMGYALSNDDYWEHKMLVLKGVGANGKSTFLRVLQDLVGAQYYSTLTPRDIQNTHLRGQLENKLFNICEELPSWSDRGTWDLYKDYCGGGEVLVNQKFKDPYSVKNKTKFLFACNSFPPCPDTSNGVLRRLILIPFDAQFKTGSQGFDPFLNNYFKNHELAGVLNLAREAYLNLKARRGFELGQTIEQEIEDYRTDTNPVAAFLDDVLEIDPTKFNGQVKHVPWVVEHGGTHCVLLEKLFQVYLERAKVTRSYCSDFRWFNEKVGEYSAIKGLAKIRSRLDSTKKQILVGASAKTENLNDAEY